MQQGSASLLLHICKVGQVREMLGAIERHATSAKSAQISRTLASLPGIADSTDAVGGLQASNHPPVCE